MSEVISYMPGFNNELLKIARGGSVGRIIGKALNVKSLYRGARDLAGDSPADVGKFLKRQVHSVTGWTPQGFMSPAGARELGAGDIESSMSAVRKAHTAVNKAPDVEANLWDRFMDRSTAAKRQIATAKANDELTKARKGLTLSHEATNMGLTSVPGYLKSMVTNGVGKTLSTGAQQQWYTSNPAERALLFGVPAVAMAHGALAKPEEGHSRLGNVATAASMAPFGPLPVTAATALTMGVEKAFKRKPKQPPRTLLPEYSPPATSEAISPGVERSVSHSAAGMPPGDILGGSPG